MIASRIHGVYVMHMYIKCIMHLAICAGVEAGAVAGAEAVAEAVAIVPGQP